MNAEETLAQIAREVAVCEKCELYHSRKMAVPGEGPAASDCRDPAAAKENWGSAS